MVSEEKILHILNLLLTGLEREGLWTYPKGRDDASREAKKTFLAFLTQMNAIADTARKRILSQKSPPIENTPQWDTLYHKYYDEELKRRGG